MARKWRCAVLGMGVIGEWHMRVLNTLPNTQFIACCDVDPNRAKQTMEKNKVAPVPVYPDLAQMLKAEKPDIVHVCTPSGNHLEPSLQAMEAGANVISEKPLEITLDRIDRMIDTAAKNKVRLACVFQNRWNPANRAIYDAARSGRFGKIAFGGCTTPWFRTNEYYRQGGWRGTWKLDGGGAAMNQSVHAIDLLQWICGDVKQVSTYASSLIHPEIEVEDTLACSLQFKSGAYGTIVATTAMYPGGNVRIEVGGENGTAVSEDGLKFYKFRDERPEDQQLLDKINAGKTNAGGGTSQFLASIQMHVDNVQSILEAWDAGRDAETSGPEARKAIALILAMYESARKNGQPVQM